LGIGLNFLFSSYHLASFFNFNFFPASPAGILIIFILILSLLFGSVWCGWLCPWGALQELLSLPRFRRDVSAPLDRRARFFKYILLFIFTIFWFFKKDNLFSLEPLESFFMRGFSFSWGRVLGLTALVGSVFFMRFWCRYFCWCGAFLSLFNRVALLKRFFLKHYGSCPMHVKSIQDIDCLQCNICLPTVKILPGKTTDRLFKIIFTLVLFILATVAVLSLRVKAPYLERAVSVRSVEAMQSADIDRIQQLIDDGKLSSHEAQYYKKVDEQL
jgi:hypothetical protein